jgi:hypothetical protein
MGDKPFNVLKAKLGLKLLFTCYPIHEKLLSRTYLSVQLVLNSWVRNSSVVK